MSQSTPYKVLLKFVLKIPLKINILNRLHNIFNCFKFYHNKLANKSQ
jgi:hypothetical protein